MKKQRAHKITAQAHKWVGLILGLQILAWTVGGVVMTWLPIEEVRSEHRIAEQPPQLLGDTKELLSLPELQARIGTPVVSIRYARLEGKPVAHVITPDNVRTIYDAVSGEKLSPISAALAEQIAVADFNLDSPVASVKHITTPITEYRRALPVWQVTFADNEETALYVSPTEARVVARRSNTWRLFDFFWMLHIMDYDERDDFNHPLLMVFALSTALFTLSGLTLLIFRFNRRDFNFILGRQRR